MTRLTTRPAALLALWLAFAALLAARDPSILLHAEFWGEDGWAWFPDAYNDGLHSLAAPVAGYLQSISRLAGLAVQPLPLAWAPTLFAAAALLAQALPPTFLVSARMQDVWPSTPARLAFALVWIALPNTREVYANLTNTQWHMATLAFLILMSRPPSTRSGQLGDILALILSGLSGPFCVLLLPIAALQALRLRDRTALLRGALVLLAAIVQAVTLLRTGGERSAASLGFDPILLTRIVAQQVLLAPLIGQSFMDELRTWPLWESGVAPVAITLAAIPLAAIAFWRGPVLLRTACILGATILLAALVRPQISKTGAQWDYMQLPGVGQRYYLMPMLTWIAILFALAAARPLFLRLLGVALCAALSFGIWNDWTIPSRQPTDFPARAAAFAALPPGAAMNFPINPLMDLVPMTLIRR